MAKHRNDTPATSGLKRREFLKLTGVAGGGLVLGFHLAARGASAQDGAAAPVDLNAFVQVRPDGKVRIYACNPEVGQGVKTSLPLIIAEELDAAWEDVVVEQSPIDAPRFGWQVAGGSFATPARWTDHRQVGAVARAMLVAAAAEAWGVAPETLGTENTAVINDASGERLSYGALAERAAAMTPPDADAVRLKERSEYRLLGKRVPGVDNAAIVTGEPLFGIDQVVEGMKYATYVRAPRLGARVASANLDAVRALPGVVDAFVVEGEPTSMLLVPGVAVIAESTWQAFEASRQLEVEWDETGASTDSWTGAQAAARDIASEPGVETIAATGDVDAALEDAAQVVEAFYEYPFLYHSPLEPMNCTAWTRDDAVEIWAPSQTPGNAIMNVAEVLGVDPSRITLHQMRIGGGFGRRLFNDFVCEAAAISRQAGAPIKLVYTREDDTTHGMYRPGGFHQFAGGLDAEGRLAGWRDHFITFAHDNGELVGAGNIAPDEFPMPAITHGKITQSTLPLTTRCVAFRAPRSNGVAFATQAFLHELSTAAGRDHKEFLLELLGEPRALGEQAVRFGQSMAPFHTGRMAQVVELATERAGWGRDMPAGGGLGLAFYWSHQGHFAEVAEVSVDADRKLTVHKMTVAADVGPIINRSAAENQCQGAVMDGFSIAAGLAITMEGGVIQQSNFHQYPLLRMPAAPEVEVHFIESDYSPTGLGEPALPPAAPAICNAIFAATGERIRSLPLSQHGFTI